MKPYLTAPVPSTSLPKGIPFIVGNEVAERLSFYGMKAILFTFMTKYLTDAHGEAAFYTKTQATEAVSWFTSLAYFFPILGALLADAFLGKYRTILFISVFYCIGHGLLAMMDMPSSILVATFSPEAFMMAGLMMVAIGAGGIKPCVSAHVGDQFGESNKHLLEPMFGWFYVAINVGAFTAYAALPVVLRHYGVGPAFAIPGIAMALATLAFWMGRHRFIHIPPAGAGYFKRAFTGQGLNIIGKLVPIYLIVAVFYSLYDQTGSAWIGQAERMDRMVFGFELHEAQIGALNPLGIVIFVPLFAYVLYPFVGRFFALTALRKAGFGMFLMVATYVLTSTIEEWIIAAELAGTAPPSIGWQVLAYAILTASEVLIAVTLLEFSYTQAMPEMKSFIVGLFFLSQSAGNAFTAIVNRTTMDEHGNSTLVGADYYWFFTKIMFVASIVFVIYAMNYKEKSYLQKEGPA
ncbi:MAG: POT family proton-dependent oligopeptide transporter [Planctomycetota bacterium]|jgi:POT family proton-dependent oligopeptide transporter